MESVNYKWIFFVILSVLLRQIPVFSQTRVILSDSVQLSKILKKKIRVIEKSRNDSLLPGKLLNLLHTFHGEGYIAASLDSIRDDDSCHIYFSSGNKYKWTSLDVSDIDKEVLRDVRFRNKEFKHNATFRHRQLHRLEDNIITWCENNGYPFASISLKPQITDGNVTAKLVLNKAKRFYYDSIVVKGPAKINNAYLKAYLGIAQGAFYNEQKIAQTKTRINELPYLKEIKPMDLVFNNDKVKVLLYLENKKSSQMDGLIGFLPDDKTGKLLFTGQGHLRLQNSIQHGEMLDINWRKLQARTQDLKLMFNYPYLFSTPFGLDGSFKLYKRDTIFIDIVSNPSVLYYLNGQNYFKVFLNNRNSTLLSTEGYKYVTVLPDYADIKSNIYGVGIKLEKLDYRINPRKGYKLTSNAGAGLKNIKKNDHINQEVYKNLVLRTSQYTGDLSGDVYLPFFKRNTFNIGLDAATIIGKNIFTNELHRIGGLFSLRGIDEESIYASSYVVSTLEYRFLFERNSYFYAFFDGAWYENNSVGKYIKDTPYGFGAGVSFETKAGIFTINYALAKQFDNPVYLRSAKIHFGIVNYF